MIIYTYLRFDGIQYCINMTSQQPITSYFSSSKSIHKPTPKSETMKSAKRKLSLRHEDIKPTEVVVLSDDDDFQPASFSTRARLQESLLQSSLDEEISSDSSSQTIIYDYSQIYGQSPSKSPQKNVPQSPTSSPKTPILKNIYNSPHSTLKYQTPSSTKFFSPNKKRKVNKKSPAKFRRNLSDFFKGNNSSKNNNNDDDDLYLKACEEQEDKTKFLLKIINDFLKTSSLSRLLDKDSLQLLSKFFTIPKLGMKLICRLFWRKEGWYKKNTIQDICLETKQDTLDENACDGMLKVLVEQNYLIQGSDKNMNFNEYTSLLKSDELKEVCKLLKLKTQTKKSAIESLQDFCKRPSISEYFTSSNTLSNSKRLLQLMSEKAGPCYKLAENTRTMLDKLYILTYLGIDYDYIREKRLELMLINEKIRRETFPVDKDMVLDNASIVFQDMDEFESYLIAHNIKESFLSTTDIGMKCSIVRRAFEVFNSIEPDSIVRYKSLPIWLQRFTPPSIYVTIMAAGVQELKKGKNRPNCELAVVILTALIKQTFREHKKAEWYAEKALILHSYLNNPGEAATVLVEGFESSLTEMNKDFMRPRAKKIAQQKNIDLDEDLRRTLMAYATKETILEGNIPSQHFYKQPMENITKGKAMYETKSDSGRLMQGVEEYALSCYLLDGEYTKGGHWEGRIITTMFFLLFWEIIYTKPKNVSGIFLSHYQRFPLDMFSKEFYSNRRSAIDKRLKLIEECNPNEVAELMMFELDSRPECELSGINRDIPRDDIASVARCLGGRRVAALCRRLALDYRHTHSGFPDLTLWNNAERKVKFVEVKSDNDKPSMKQIQWMQYMLENEIETEFCYVGANTTRPKARKQNKPVSNRGVHVIKPL